jgi:hypothetical protein
MKHLIDAMADLRAIGPISGIDGLGSSEPEP